MGMLVIKALSSTSSSSNGSKRLELVKEGSITTFTTFQIITTLCFGFSISMFIVILGFFLSHRIKEFFILSEEYFYSTPQMITMSPSYDRKFIPFGSGDWFATRKDLWHSMSDKELIWRASMTPLFVENPYKRIPKVAFMFLARRRLPLRPLWERFFKGNDKRMYSIYLHSSPDFKEELSELSVFYNRRIPSKVVEWGKASMIDAERRLLANALLDFSNERFILLSETCIPLFNFTTIYKYLINSKYSFLSSFDDPRLIGRGRYNKRMWPTITLKDWRKGSQWFEVQRKIALDFMSDSTYYQVFRDYCKPPCYMDEHYMATLVKKQNPELNSNRSITWVDWSNGGSHPKSFLKKHISVVFLNGIRHGFTNCTYNDNISGSFCFLFARKFHSSTLEPLLMLAPKLYGVDP